MVKPHKREQYEEIEDCLIFRQLSSAGLEFAIFSVVFFTFIISQIVVLMITKFELIIVPFFIGTLAFAVQIFKFVYNSFTDYEIIINKKQRLIEYRCINHLLKKQKSIIISFSKIQNIQIIIGEGLSVDLVLRVWNEETVKVSLTASPEFTSIFESTQNLSNKLLDFIDIPPDRLSFEPYNFRRR